MKKVIINWTRYCIIYFGISYDNDNIKNAV